MWNHTDCLVGDCKLLWGFTREYTLKLKLWLMTVAAPLHCICFFSSTDLGQHSCNWNTCRTISQRRVLGCQLPINELYCTSCQKLNFIQVLLNCGTVNMSLNLLLCLSAPTDLGQQPLYLSCNVKLTVGCKDLSEDFVGHSLLSLLQVQKIKV